MNSSNDFSEFEKAIKAEAERTGYILNPDEEFLKTIFEGLFANQQRYGYLSCPCRLGDGEFMKDIDIICPCLYRDPDLWVHGRCLCALYVNESYISGGVGRGPIPDRRPEKRAMIRKVGDRVGVKKVGEHYRCNVCGNEVTATKVGGGVLVCCGEEMELTG
ncbi:MAG: ferredoxin-thioredoxin reductase catalytic domain-containing protein [Candidatus Hydrothermarchaeales archaeon]